jgi:hypothetical protein
MDAGVDRGHGGSQLLGRPAMRANRQVAQAVQHVGVAADIPARLEASPVVNKADGMDAPVVLGIEFAGEQTLPMGGLGLLEMGNLVTDQRLEMRFRCGVPVETVENYGQLRFDGFPEFPQCLRSRREDTHETGPGSQIAVVYRCHNILRV